jgi:hypothetical protein
MAAPTLREFERLISKYGISSSNLYDISFGAKISSNSSDSKLLQSLKRQYSNDIGTNYNAAEQLRFYTDDVNLPGLQLVTGSYKINNSPAYSYAVDAIYPEMSITFILDAYMNQKKLFEKWIDFIKPMSVDSKGLMMRMRYRDEYVTNITIDKYERYGNAYKPNDIKLPIKINKGSETATSNNSLLKYSVRLHNAYPTSISSVQLNSGSSQLNRVTVGFKYEYLIQSSNNNIGVAATLENVV